MRLLLEPGLTDHGETGTGEEVFTMDRKPKQYTPKFKLHAVLESFQRDQTHRDVCRQVGISPSMLRRWRQIFRKQAPTIFLRQAEREAAAHARELEAIVEALPDGLLVYNAEGRILRSNTAARQLFGLEARPEFLTLTLQERAIHYAPLNEQGQPVPLEDLALSRLLRGEALTSDQAAEECLQTPDGHEVAFSITGRPLRDAEGTIIGAVTIARDVTQRRLEQQTHVTLDALLAMAEALVQAPGATGATPSSGAPRASSEADPALPVVARRLADLTRRVLGFQYVSIVAVDPTTERLTPITVAGFSPEQEQQWWASWGRPFRLDERLSPSLAARLRTGKPELIESTQQAHRWHSLFAEMTSLLVPMHMGDTLVGVLRLEGHRLHPAGTRQQETALTKAVARLGALVLERERLLLERTEARASELALRETQAQMETFLGIAGHELKTPLTSLKLALQLIERRLRRLLQQEPDRAQDLATFQDQVALAEHQAVRLDRLVNDLLDVSRARVDRLDLHPVPADLAALVGEAVLEQRQANPSRLLAFQSPADWRVPILADADRIEQVVTNYLTNALKYSPEDCPVAVGLDVEEEHVRVWVRDQGPGLLVEEQERIWEPFHRVQGIEVQSGSGVGLGLGLHICRTIIERHQGQVGVESAPGKGSTFWFTLPLSGQEENRVLEPG